MTTTNPQSETLEPKLERELFWPCKRSVCDRCGNLGHPRCAGQIKMSDGTIVQCICYCHEINNARVRDSAVATVDNRPRIICLCGSTRFIEQFAILTWELERQGFIVLGCTLLPMWYCNVPSHFGEATGTKEQCDELHMRKIDLADEILVLNIGGYIGESTANEIAYAMRIGKPVRYVEPNAESAASPVAPRDEASGLTDLQEAYNQGVEDAKCAIRAESQGGGYWAATFINAIARRCSPFRYTGLPREADEATREQIVQAITNTQEARESHVQWAAHLRNVAHPLCEGCDDFAAHIGDARYHDEWVARYDNVIAVLARVLPAGAAQDEPSDLTQQSERHE